VAMLVKELELKPRKQFIDAALKTRNGGRPKISRSFWKGTGPALTATRERGQKGEGRERGKGGGRRGGRKTPSGAKGRRGRCKAITQGGVNRASKKEEGRRKK